MKNFNIERIISLFFFSTIFLVAFPQAEKPRFKHLFIENGLRNITISFLLQDKKGYLWFGTGYGGLMKYDGYNFITYAHSPRDTGSLIQNYIFALWEDSEGLLWVGTAASGISKFDRKTGKFTQYQPEPDSTIFVPPFRAVSAINEDKEGYLWVGTYLGELRRFDKKSGTFFPEKYDLDYGKGSDTTNQRNGIYCIYKDHTGNLWIGDDQGLHKLIIHPGITNQPSKIRFDHYRRIPGDLKSLSNNTVCSIFEDHAGMIWVGGYKNEGGLNSLNPGTREFTRYLHDPKDLYSISSNSILRQAIVEDSAGYLWVATRHGLNKLNRERTKFTRYFNDPNDPESLGGNNVTSLLIDSSGILWVGNGVTGVDKLDPHQKPFGLFNHNIFNDNSISNDTVSTITGDKEDMIWVGTWRGGIDALNKRTGEFKHYLPSVKKHGGLGGNYGSIILSGDRDKDGRMWISLDDTLSLFNSKTGKGILFSPELPNFKMLYTGNQGISLLYEDQQGLLWMGTGNGLKRFDPKTGKITVYRHDPKNFRGIADHVIWSMSEDKYGYLWMGHGSVGLSKLDKETEIFTHYLPDPHDSTSLSTSNVNSIFKDSKGHLWFGTAGGGLCRFNDDKQTFTTYSEKQGLADNTIWSVQEDKEGNLWLGTQNGISRFSPVTETFTNYDAGDGLPATIYSLASFSSRDGTLYYGSKNGLIYFDPRKLRPNLYIPPVVITLFKLFDKEVPGKNEAEEIFLNHDENFFSFEFSALNYTNPSKNQYAYQLVGVDKDWVYCGNRRVASYTKIGPGEYVFRVKASNNDGIWNEKGISLRIIIQPPWWRTWLAYAFYFLCLVAAIFMIDRIQRRRVINKERERTRQREVEHAREIEKAYHQLKSTQSQLLQQEKMASLGELTAGIAHEIQNPLNFVNNFSEVNAELIDELQNELNSDNKEEAIAISNDIKENEQKINHHGKRADAIVKGMLQHSRMSTGQKEPTDINALADEYLRLSYHGFRAKDPRDSANKSFNATLQTDFDQSIGKVNIIRQDIGRVLLNLYNNAFYAVFEKKKQAGESYEPIVSVSTKRIESKLEIKVGDNGNGIPQKVIDKIFQPFFTTKPTGQGTGLGLSLSYDIIKVHEGEIIVESKEGEGTAFIIQLPLS